MATGRFLTTGLCIFDKGDCEWAHPLRLDDFLFENGIRQPFSWKYHLLDALEHVESGVVFKHMSCLQAHAVLDALEHM